MINSLLIAIGGIILLMVMWAFIQSMWGRTFSDYIEDQDVLAERTSCGNCGCTTACSNRLEK